MTYSSRLCGSEKNLKNKMIFTDLTAEDRRDIIDYVSDKTGLSRAVIEKDWWVTAVLRAVFSLPYSDNISFKGGTNLSKCWNLINRMSEDIDIAVSREYLGFSGNLSKNQISDKLRRASCSFVRNTMTHDVESALVNQGISSDMVEVSVNETTVSTVDPETIYIAYKPIFEGNEYVLPQVKIEVSGRSMSEPVTKVRFVPIYPKTFRKSHLRIIRSRSTPSYPNALFWRNCSCCMRNLQNHRRR